MIEYKHEQLNVRQQRNSMRKSLFMFFAHWLKIVGKSRLPTLNADFEMTLAPINLKLSESLS